MKNVMIYTIAALILLIGAGNSAASSTACNFDMGSGSSVDTSGTDNALKMFALVNPNLDNIAFSLEEGESREFYFATIGTTETWINDDDMHAGSVSAMLDFDSPNVMVGVNGLSIGFSATFQFLPEGLVQGWTLSWADPVSVDCGNGMRILVELSDISHVSILWQGPNAAMDVYAKVTLDSAGSPESVVPVPSTILLLFPALISLIATKSRKHKSVWR